jgi:ABC-type oligopeptide transport system ATPase subunit
LYPATEICLFFIQYAHILNVYQHNTSHSVAVVYLLNLVTLKLTNTIQRKLKVSSTQLLYQSAPYQAAILFATGPFVDQLLTNRSVFAHKYTFPVVVSAVSVTQIFDATVSVQTFAGRFFLNVVLC